MNRKKFLSAVVPLSVSLQAIAKGRYVNPVPIALPHENSIVRVPPYLQQGDMIGITCPSGFISLDDVQPAINKMKEWGFSIRTGDTVGVRDFTFAGSDEQRVKDFQKMIDDPAIKAIMLGRGGYGAVRIIDKIDFTKFVLHPKWIIGFSDATVFHCHINKTLGIATLHSKMCNSFPDNWVNAEPLQIDSIESIKKCLTGEKMIYKTLPDAMNRQGIAEGAVVGGNLSILQNLAASKSDINTDGKILFIEEVDEYFYSIDRMFWNLKRSGKLNNLLALIIGGFNKIKPDDPGEEFGKTLYEIILEKVVPYKYPVCFNFPVGHQKVNYAIKCGIKHKLEVTDIGVLLKEV